MKNIEETLLSQYANSPTICTILNSFNETIDPRANAMSSIIWRLMCSLHRDLVWISGGG
ncbi:hypothetical protein [Xenorhabdus bovienii]|uniref:hypothetical protein n=1 Tax=Xenorhabdus bovienii TaxID=40576 RepID=UPI000A49D5B0|nr:hypothetical protein [Xenorhabdus bovienii]MDE9480695.1 DUF2612 domain-containing protein [Xenorhabdus bovienii]